MSKPPILNQLKEAWVNLPVSDRFRKAGWVVSTNAGRPRVTTFYTYTKGCVVIQVEQQGSCETEWTVTITCNGCLARSVKYGGTPSQAIRQSLASMVGCIGDGAWSSKIRKDLIKLQKTLPPQLED